LKIFVTESRDDKNQSLPWESDNLQLTAKLVLQLIVQWVFNCGSTESGHVDNQHGLAFEFGKVNSAERRVEVSNGVLVDVIVVRWLGAHHPWLVEVLLALGQIRAHIQWTVCGTGHGQEDRSNDEGERFGIHFDESGK